MCQPHRDLADFPFNLKKMSVSGALFDMAKLTDVSKTVISKMTAQEVFDLAHAWADRHQPELAVLFDSDPAYAVAVLSIDRGGKSPARTLPNGAIWRTTSAISTTKPLPPATT